MPKLVFKIAADYEAVIRLREEISKLEAQLKRMDVNKSPAAAKALETQLASTRQQMMGLVTEAAKTGAVMENDLKTKIYNASQSVNDFTQKIINQKRVVKDVGYDVKRLGDAYRIALKRNPIGASSLLSEYQAAKKALYEEKATLFDLTQQQAEARLSVKRLRDEYSAFKEEAGEATKANEGMSLSLTKVLSIIGGVTALKGFISELINVRGQFQQLEIAFSTMLKSKEAADKLMAELVDIAAKTPFDLQGVAQSAKQMIAYGSSAENVGDELIMLGNVAAGVGSQLSEIAYLYGTLRTQGRAYAVDIRQFAGRGIPIYEELAKVLGVTKDEVSGLVKEGKVGFKEVEQAFKNMTSESGIYYNLMQEQSKSLTGQISNLGDAWDTMLNDMGKSTQGIASAGISALKGLIENYETVGKILIGLIATYGIHKAAVIVNIALTKNWAVAARADATAKALQTVATKAQTLAQAALNSVMKANPYVLVATTLAGVVAAMWAFSDSASAAEKAQKRFNDEQQKFIDKEAERKRKVEELIRVIQDSTETELEKIKSYEELQKYSPALTSAYSREEIATLNLADAQKKLNEERDKNNYQNIIDNIEKAKNAIKEYTDARQAASLNPNSNNQIAIYTSKIEDAKKDLDKWQSALDEFNRVRRQAEENAKPIEIKLTVAEREYQDSKMKLDYMSDFVIAMKKEVEGTMMLNIDGSPAEKDTESIIKDIEKKIKEVDKIPMSVEQMKVRDDLSEIREYMLLWKKESARSGIFTVPIQFQLKLNSLKTDTNQKKDKFNYLTGQYEDEKPELFKDAYKNAEKRWNNAKKNYEKLRKSAKSTKDEVVKAKETMEEAEKLFKELGGTSQTSKKQANAENQVLKREEAIRKQTESLKNLEKKQSLDRKRETADLEEQVEQARINAMADGSKKIIAQREYDNKKELAAIDRAKEEYIQKEIQRQKEIFDAEENLKAQKNPKYKKKSFNSSAVSVDTSSFDELKYYTEQKQIQDRLKAEKDAMNTYLMEYGTYQQRKLAIAEEYAQKIQEAQNEGERLTLIKEREKSISDVNLSAIKQNIDWAGVFGDFGTMLRDEIEQSLEAVRKYMKSDEFRSMAPEDQAKIVEAVNNLRGNVSGNLSDINFKEIGELTTELQNAQRKMITAYSAEIAAYDNLKKAQDNYHNAMESGTSEQKLAAKSNLDTAQTVAENMSQAYKQAVGEFNASGNNLKDATDCAVDAINSVSSSISQIRSNSLSSAYEGTQQLTETLGKSLSGLEGMLGKAGGALSKFASSLGGATGEIVSAALGLLDLLKDGLGSIFADLSDLMFNAVNGILDDILSGGIIMKPLKSVVDGVSNILNTITFGGLNSWLGGNDKDVMKTVSRLTESNEYLQESIDRLRERIGDESNTAGQTLDYYLTAKDAEEQWRENQQEIIKNLASAWTNTGYGFMGLGGKGSFNGHAPDSNWSGWDYFSETLKSFGFDVTLRNSEDFWNLTPEQMELLRDNNPKEWQKLFDSDGHKNPLEAVEEYIEHAGKLEELTNVLNENLTKISFDSLYDNFIDTLMDMDASAEDFADNMSEYFMRAVLSDKVGEMFKTRLNEWYNAFALAMKDGNLDDYELKNLRDDYENIVKDAMAERDDLANAIGYTSSDNEQQSASKKGYATASQDSIDELSGRTTAMYESNLRIETAEQQQTVAITELRGSISALTAQASGMYNIADETRTILANSYLELQQIRENTGEIIKPIKQMQADIAEVKRNTARL